MHWTFFMHAPITNSCGSDHCFNSFLISNILTTLACCLRPSAPPHWPPCPPALSPSWQSWIFIKLIEALKHRSKRGQGGLCRLRRGLGGGPLGCISQLFIAVNRRSSWRQEWFIRMMIPNSWYAMNEKVNIDIKEDGALFRGEWI